MAGIRDDGRRAMRRVRALAGALLVGPALGLGTARADDAPSDPKQACIAAAEQGQSQRDDGKYRGARVSFLACAQDSCPRVVVQSCTKWLRELDESAPTIVVAAKDEHGDDLTDVKVTFDGAPFATELDGKPLEADSGEHVLHFEREGSTPVDVKLLLRAGEKARVVSVTLRSITPGEGAPAPEPVMSAHHVTSVALGIAGLAAAGAGVYFLLQSNHQSSQADALRASIGGDPGACAAPSAAVAGTCTSLNDAVQKKHDDMNVATGLFIGGGALVAGAVIAWLVWPKAHATEPATTGAILPLPGGAVVSVSGTF
jgi:hypothetical protein